MNEHRGLWRGKRIANVEWVYGVPLQHCDGDWQLISGKVGAMVIQTVIADTLGECTGLTDKNGKLIFEGDIISVVQGKDKGTAIISYEHGSFVAVPVTGNIYERTLWDYWYNDWEIQLISNIHDNPELLESEANLNET